MLLIQALSQQHLAYYFRYSEKPGVYGGVGSKTLGLSGSLVSQQSLEALGRGLDPRTGAAFEGRLPVRNAAYGCVFPAPKSVSLLFGLSDPSTSDGVVAAHRAAETAALSYLDRVASWSRRRTGGQRTLQRTDGLVWASFLHMTSRAGDPHLHSHVLILNLASSGGRTWSALDASPLFAECPVAGRVYENELRYELVRRFGHLFRSRSRPASDVVGFSDRVLDAFSLRSLALRDDPHAPRPPKVAQPGQAVLVSRWREQAASLGVVDGTRALVAGVVSTERSVRDAAESALAAFDRPFRRSELLLRILRAGSLAAPASQIESAVDRVLEEQTERLRPGQLQAFENPSLRLRSDRRTDERYVTQEVARLLVREAVFCSAAAPLDVRNSGTTLAAVFAASDLVTASTSSNPIATYAALRSLGESLQRSGGTLRAVSPTVRSLAEFEALTGLPGEVVDGRAEPIRGDVVRGDVVVLVDLARLSVVRRVALIERQLERGARVVVLDAWRRDSDDDGVAAPSALSWLGSPAGEVRWLQVAGTSIAFVDSLVGALAALRGRVGALGPMARAVVPRRLSAWVGAANVPPSAVRSAVKSGLGPFVVLGGRRSLDRPREGTTFEHVGVEPLGLRANEREAAARALIAAPRRTLGGHVRYSSEEWRAAGWIALANDRSVERTRDGFERTAVGLEIE